MRPKLQAISFDCFGLKGREGGKGMLGDALSSGRGRCPGFPICVLKGLCDLEREVTHSYRKSRIGGILASVMTKITFIRQDAS